MISWRNLFYSGGFCRRVIIHVDNGLPFLPSVDLSRIKAFTVDVVGLSYLKSSNRYLLLCAVKQNLG